MNLLPILLVVIVLAVDEGLRPVGLDWGLGSAAITVMALVPVALAVLWAHLAARWCIRRIDRTGDPHIIFAADRMIRWARWLLIFNHAMVVLVFGWLQTVRSLTGNLVFVDEFIAVLPPLIGMLGTWWAYYPIETRVRNAVMIRKLDEGETLYPDLTRTAYVLLQLRLQVLLALAPILLIMAVRELIEVLAHHYAPLNWRDDIQHLTTLVMAVSIFLFAPVIARFVLDVRPIAAGPLRQSLLDVCARHNVKARELLIWNTNGTMINAAVMGLIGPLRYVMITDALLESLPEEQVRAVMAHEIGHVRRRHLPWLVVCLMAAFALSGVFIMAPLWIVESNGWINSQRVMDWAGLVAGAAQLGLGLFVFGWISRRFERQADTFAVQHLSGLNDPAVVASSANTAVAVQPQAVHAMCGALDSIARLNTINIHRPSWRHGSIAWRMNYLMSIIGRPVTKLPIDRMIRWIKIAAAVLLVGIVGTETWLSMKARQEQVRREQIIERIEQFRQGVLATLREWK